MTSRRKALRKQSSHAGRIIIATSPPAAPFEVFSEVFHHDRDLRKLMVELKKAGRDLQKKMSAGVHLKDLRKEISRVKNATHTISEKFPGYSRWLPVSVSWRRTTKGHTRIEIDLPPALEERVEPLVEQIDAFFKGETEERDGRGKKKKVDADLRAVKEYRKIKEAASRGEKHYIDRLKNEIQNSRSADVVRGRVKKRAVRILQNHKISE